MDSVFNLEQTQSVYNKHVLQKHPLFEKVLKLEQAQVIHGIVSGKDILATLPTSFGKFLCMVSPSLILNSMKGVTGAHIIVSPLIALALEQVKTLNERGLKAVQVGDAGWDSREYCDAAKNGLVFFVTSPESLKKIGLRNLLQDTQVVCISIDEGHCVTQWGKSFRKDYAVISEIRSWFPAPMGVFTATLTHEDKSEVMAKTGLRKDCLVHVSKSPDRPEIFINVKPRAAKMESLRFLVQEVKQRRLDCLKTIVFANTITELNDMFYWLRKQSDDFSRHYYEDGSFTYMVEMFSGNTNDATKSRIIDEFVKPDGKIRILLATIAFGMGLNIPNLKRVVIYKLPESVSILWQEIGRAGRLGESSECYIFVPKNPLESTLGASLTNACVRNTILKNFSGFQQPEATSFVCSDACVKCECSFCRCCSFCSSTCPCVSMK